MWRDLRNGELNCPLILIFLVSMSQYFKHKSIFQNMKNVIPNIQTPAMSTWSPRNDKRPQTQSTSRDISW
jgi:hypothetical protein